MSLLTSLVSYWKLDEASGNATDSHGSNTLTETSGTIASTTGKINNCRDFEAGDTEHFLIADNTDLSTGDIDFTISCWVNFESFGGSRALVSKFLTTGNQREYELLYLNGNQRLEFTVSNNGSGTVSVDANNLGTPSTATWYFVVAWHDATANTINIQVNNGTVDSAAHTTGVFNGTAGFSLGARENNSQNHDGLLDEVGFWKRVLTTQERTDLYNSGAGLPYASFGGGNTYNETASGGDLAAGSATPSLVSTVSVSGGVLAAGAGSYSALFPMGVSGGATVAGTALISFVDNVTLQDIVGGRIYPLNFPQKLIKPAICYTITQNEHLHQLSGAAGVSTATIDFEILADTEQDKLNAANALHDALQQYSGTLGSVEILGARAEDYIDLDQPPDDGSDEWLYRCVLSFAVTYRESRPEQILTIPSNSTEAVEQSLVSYLASIAPVSPVLAQVATYPAIVFHRTLAGLELDLTQEISPHFARYDLTVLAKRYRDCELLGEQVRLKTDGVTGMINNTAALAILIETESTTYSRDARGVSIYWKTFGLKIISRQP